MNIRLLIADDHEVIRSGLTRLMDETDIDVVAAAADGDEAVRLVQERRPDVALLDIRMNRMDGFAALDRIKRENPELPVLILSLYNNPTYVARAVELGAAGYLPKGLSREQIVDAIHLVAAGESTWSRDDYRKIAATPGVADSPAEVDHPLTTRESEVLKLVADGQTNKQIAANLSISAETVKEHVQHILRKLGVYDRTQAAVWAVRNNLA